jgi:PAS domain S-box-containing protein
MKDSLPLVDSLDQKFIARHSRILAQSYQRWTGTPLLSEISATSLFDAPFALLSHGIEPDPLFNYANRYALRLFGMAWEDIIGMPSRFSAEPMVREERDRLLERVARHGYVDDYAGVRIAKDGSRFMIRNAIVWNLVDEEGLPYGQAACIKQHIPL